MFELPECVTLVRQMNATLPGKTIQCGQLGNSPHKFVWYNRSHEEFEQLTEGRVVGSAKAKGKWMFIPLEPDYVLLLGDCGGKVLYHPTQATVPERYHLLLAFTDGSAFSVTTQMWGIMDLFVQGEEQNRYYVKDMRPTPDDAAFTFDYFNALIDSLAADKKRSVKGLLTLDQLIPGLGNSIAQDVLFRAHLHPKHLIIDLDHEQRQGLFEAIVRTVQLVIDGGGRSDEVDLYNHRGGYVRIMQKDAVGRSCPDCGHPVAKLQYLGGACYYCPHCQQ